MTGADEPGYIALYESGELKRRAEILEVRLAACDICPRKCGVNRLEGQMGFCHSGAVPLVSTLCAHHGEEPVISGSKGSGTIFFGNCNMRCVYCQNYQISHDWKGLQSKEMDCRILAERMLYLQNALGCHNINFVSPSHFVPQIVRAVLEAVPMGLRIPLVYNTNSYDTIESLKALEGIINIYLPDLRYACDKWARKYSYAPGYAGYARAAIKEMYRQVGNLVLDEAGLAQRGLIVRHLILPNGLAGSSESLSWLVNEISPEVTVSIMSQYYPAYRAPGIAELSRKITQAEYSQVFNLVDKLGLENGWMQDMGSSENYLPDFQFKDNPFEPYKQK
jgi:putative pyruvate formate lyase activating enzyme